MPQRVCVLAASQREARAWAKQNGLRQRDIFTPHSATSLSGPAITKIVELPSWSKYYGRHSINQTVNRIMRRRRHPEYVKVEAFHPAQLTVFDALRQNGDLGIPFRLPEPVEDSAAGTPVAEVADEAGSTLGTLEAGVEAEPGAVEGQKAEEAAPAKPKRTRKPRQGTGDHERIIKDDEWNPLDALLGGDS